MSQPKDHIHIARNIARLRRKMGLTQTELSERLYVSNKTVSKWERGAGYPEIPQLVRLADLFGVTLDSLIRGEKNGIAVAGNILTDEVKIIESFPEKGMLVGITAMSRAVGGSVPNTLISLAKIDPTLSLSALGKRGDDESGRYVQSELQRCGIDTSGILVDPKSPTGFSDVMTLRDTGERTFFHNRGANAKFIPEDINLSTLNCRMLHVAYIHLLDGFDAPDPEYGTTLARFLKAAQEEGILTSIDVVSSLNEKFAERIIAALPYTDNAIMNVAPTVAETLTKAGIPHYTGADSFVQAGSFTTCGVNYTELGTYTAGMAMDILLGGATPAFHVMDGGIITVNTDTAAALNIDYSVFSSMANTVVEVQTAG